MAILSKPSAFEFLVSLFLILCIFQIHNSLAARRISRYGYKLMGDKKAPFVLLYEHESFRGKEHVQFFGKECVTLKDEFSKWASSLDTHRSCVDVCQGAKCEGPCHKVFSNQGISKLRLVGFNDNIQSLRSCYQF